MSNQTSFIESKNNIVDNSFSLSPELEHGIIKNNSQDKQAEYKDQALPKKLSRTQSQESETLSETDRLYERKIEASKEAYRLARELGTYDYYRFARDFPDELDEQVKCPTCEEMIYVDNKDGMCYTCFDIEQKLYPDDIPMELRYNN